MLESGGRDESPGNIHGIRLRTSASVTKKRFLPLGSSFLNAVFPKQHNRATRKTATYTPLPAHLCLGHEEALLPPEQVAGPHARHVLLQPAVGQVVQRLGGRGLAVKRHEGGLRITVGERVGRSWYDLARFM